MDKKLKDRSDTARERILNRLKGAKQYNNGPTADASWSVRVFPQPDKLLETFTDEFNKVSGQLIVCESKTEIRQHLEGLIVKKGCQKIFCIDDELRSIVPLNASLISQSEFADVEASITRCEFLIARSGSIMVSSAQQSGRLVNVFPPVHIVVASQKQLVLFLEDAVRELKNKYGENLPSQATVITGPSRTADIEKTLVMGAHGPKELILFIHK
ncbi:LutC/YkgG family protein [Carboxylicivirga sp. RSCT41]|uniref:LutC/YkgG family protein n=1 Tax=Carboxylicivirga agarovorans TaxID=3417570 RepID=UPI003D326577